MVSERQIWIIASIAVLTLIGLTAIHLDKQGAYYDELHQAPAAFHYIGRHPIMFTWAYRGVPLLNMTYSGAIKSGVYGLLLKYFLSQFTITSWRLLGITFVALGLVGFYGIAGKRLSSGTAILFPALLLTDSSVILTTRHDWGPTALALGLRLIFIALWISIEYGKPADYKFGTAAFMVGVAMFEKLSSVVLILPLIVMLLTARTFRRRTWVFAAVGLLTGAFPLVIANVATYRLGQGVISLSDAKSDKDRFTIGGIVRYGYDYLSLGQGEKARTEILGEGSQPLFIEAEALLTALGLIIIMVAASHSSEMRNRMRLAAVFAAMYGVVAAGLLLLPRSTFIHHWIIGTPFQYAAFALALPVFDKRSSTHKVFLTLMFCLIALRVPTVAVVEHSLLSGRSSQGFDPALNRLIQFAGKHASDSVYISSDWGSGTQLYCGAGGQDDTVFEPFWNTAPEEGVPNITANTQKNTIYLVTTGLATQFSHASDVIIHLIQTQPGWVAAAPDEETGSFGQIQIRKFVRQVK